MVGERLRDWGRLFTLSAASALRGIRDNLRLTVWQPFALSLGLGLGSFSTFRCLMGYPPR